jgi:hypothetical protein
MGRGEYPTAFPQVVLRQNQSPREPVFLYLFRWASLRGYGNPLRLRKQTICEKLQIAESFCVIVTIASATFPAKLGLSTLTS